jgi:hypothetical protein
VFSGISWSSAQTGAHQAARIRVLKIPLVESAKTWPDVDEAADLPELKKRLEAQPLIAPRTLSVLRALG